jgi:DNA-binding MarR family transcriptional regulator
MSQEHTLKQALHAWAEVFMRQSFSNFKRFMDDWDLSPSQMSTLFLLNHCSRCGVSDLGEHLGVTNAAASQLVERLVKQDFISRMEDPGDRRYKVIQLTPHGQSVIEESIQVRLLWLEEITTNFTQEEQETIIHAMNLLTEAARNLEPGAAAAAHKTASAEAQ